MILKLVLFVLRIPMFWFRLFQHPLDLLLDSRNHHRDLFRKCTSLSKGMLLLACLAVDPARHYSGGNASTHVSADPQAKSLSRNAAALSLATHSFCKKGQIFCSWAHIPLTLPSCFLFPCSSKGNIHMCSQLSSSATFIVIPEL